MPIAAEIYYQEYEGEKEGKRPPVVLLHGAGGTHLYWPAEVRRMAGCRVYALDLPGHGKSGGRGQQSIEGYARAVLNWMGATGLHAAVFTGHSMGSAIALSIALESPEHVLGLGLVGAGARLRVAADLLRKAANASTWMEAVEAVIARSFSPHAPARLVELAGQRMAETRPSVFYADLQACDAFDIMARASEITCPALVLCGEDDQMTPLRYAQFLAGSLPAARLQVIPQSGHMVMLERPQAVAAALKEFLEKVAY